MSIQESETKFCNNIKALREKQGLTVEELSRRSGVPLKMLEELERDELPDEMVVEDAFALACTFRCKIHELFE